MSFHELSCFVEVCRHGGVTAAAASLGIAKSAVSKQLSRLEERLGVQLLERSSRRVQITRAGQRLLPRVDSLLAEGERLIEQAKQERGEPEGLVRIAATPEFGSLVARCFFPQAARSFPRIRLLMSATYAFEDLQDPAFDLGIRIGRVNDDQLVANPLGSFSRVLVASPAFVEEHPITSPEDLAGLPCLGFSETTTEHSWGLEGPRNVNHRVQVSGPFAVRNFNALAELAVAGAGVAYVPDFVVAAALDAGHLVRCLPELQSRPTPVQLVFRVGVKRVRRVRVILDLAMRILPGLLERRVD